MSIESNTDTILLPVDRETAEDLREALQWLLAGYDPLGNQPEYQRLQKLLERLDTLGWTG